MEAKAYLKLLATQLADELRPNESIRKFTRNPAMIGAYTEASVRQFVHRVVAPLRVSTGSIVHEGNIFNQQTKVDMPQLDTIIWQPSPLPAIFERGEFAIVPRHSAVSFLEIKSSDYAGIVDAINKNLRHAESLIPDEYSLQQSFPKAMAVICIQRKTSLDSELEKHRQTGKLIVLMRQKNEDDLEVNSEDVYQFTNYLVYLRLIGKYVDGKTKVNS